MEDKRNFYVVADGANIVSKDHTCKQSPHLPPGGNILIAFTIGFATSAWKLAVSSVIATAGPVASTHFGTTGYTTNCGDPVSLPTGWYESPGSVHVTPSASDWADYAVDWAISAAVEFAVSAGLYFALPAAKSLIARQVFRNKQVMSEAVSETASNAAGKLTRYRGPGDPIILEEAENASKHAARMAESLLERGMSPEKATTRATELAVERAAKNQGLSNRLAPQAATEVWEKGGLKANIRKAAGRQAESGKLAPIDGAGDLAKQQAGDAKDKAMKEDEATAK